MPEERMPMSGENTPTVCQDHPQYTATLPPPVPCLPCWQMYNANVKKNHRKPKRVWWYMTIKKDTLYCHYKDGKPTSPPSQHVEVEEAVVCSDPACNWTATFKDDAHPPITHPLEYLEFLNTHFRNWKHSPFVGEESRENNHYEIIFFTEIPEYIALWWKEHRE